MTPSPLAPLYVPGGVLGTNLVSRETAPSAEQVEMYRTSLAMVTEELRLMDQVEAQRSAESFYGAESLPAHHQSRQRPGGKTGRRSNHAVTRFPSGLRVPTKMDFINDERPLLAQNLRKLTPGDYGPRPYHLIHRKGAKSTVHPGGQFELSPTKRATRRGDARGHVVI